MKIGDRVIWRGAVYQVVETGVRFNESWVAIRSVWRGELGPIRRWVPTKHVRLPLPAQRVGGE